MDNYLSFQTFDEDQIGKSQFSMPYGAFFVEQQQIRSLSRDLQQTCLYDVQSVFRVCGGICSSYLPVFLR